MSYNNVGHLIAMLFPSSDTLNYKHTHSSTLDDFTCLGQGHKGGYVGISDFVRL